jgi:hypothetical protein
LLKNLWFGSVRFVKYPVRSTTRDRYGFSGLNLVAEKESLQMRDPISGKTYRFIHPPQPNLPLNYRHICSNELIYKFILPSNVKLYLLLADVWKGIPVPILLKVNDIDFQARLKEKFKLQFSARSVLNEAQFLHTN